MNRFDGPLREDIVAIRGGGDLATGVAQKFFRAGMRVVILEMAHPLAIRRTVSLCAAVTSGVTRVEDMTARLVMHPEDCRACWSAGEIPVLVDPDAQAVRPLTPSGMIDAMLAKRNMGTHRAMAPIVIALGPGFAAPADCLAVVETMRGHQLGRVLFEGSALQNTGVPGEIGGRGAERVLRAPREGRVRLVREIGDIVAEGDAVLFVEGEAVRSPFGGLVRGLISEGTVVKRGLKIGDIDPRTDSGVSSVSDKARAVGGGALEAYLFWRNQMAGAGEGGG